MGNIAGRAGGERVTSKGSAELEVGNIVPGVFTPVLAKTLEVVLTHPMKAVDRAFGGVTGAKNLARRVC